jgi:hypothetical protein
MPEVWLALLDRTGANQDQHARRKLKRISLPRKELRRNRALGGGMKITVLGIVLIVVVVIVAILLIRHFDARQNQSNQPTR